VIRLISWNVRISAAGLIAGFVMAAAVAPKAQRQPSAHEAPTAAVNLTPQAADKGYVGEDRCRSCHKAEATEFHKTPHANLADARSSQAMNCETCHGAGQAHSEAEEAAHGDDAKTVAANLLIFSFHGTVQANTARCLTCHTAARGQQAFAHSQHAGAGVSCQSCHATHMVETVRPTTAGTPRLAQAALFTVPQLPAETRWLRESLLKDSQPNLCYTCHAAERAQFAQPFHHRVPEGSMKCTDCHSVHGSENRASLSQPAWETCTTCHADKHGPFLFEHAAVKVEGCAICHTPHGSVSRFLLARRESRFLCLQCHGDTHSDIAGVPHSRLGFQTRGDCTRCHTAVHGSNFNQYFLE
jgi:predicted CXXCH cytochrome family protein